MSEARTSVEARPAEQPGTRPHPIDTEAIRELHVALRVSTRGAHFSIEDVARLALRATTAADVTRAWVVAASLACPEAHRPRSEHGPPLQGLHERACGQLASVLPADAAVVWLAGRLTSTAELR